MTCGKDDALRQKVEKIMEMPYKGKVEVKHLAGDLWQGGGAG